MRNHILYRVAFLAAILLQVHPILAQGSNNRKSYEPEMVFVEGGTFQMGSESGVEDELPVHSVTLSDYYIGAYEVTQAQWREVMGGNRSAHSDCDQCPVEQVSWDDVQEYIELLNSMTGKLYRLPTEAEWEFAAGAGQSYRLPWGDELMLNGRLPCNIWQGKFPNDPAIGWTPSTVPVKSY